MEFVGYGTRTGWGVVAATTLASGMAFLDGTVVNVALRTIGQEFDASLAQLQWIANGYLLTLASLILLGGSLGDRYGRRRVFELGVVGFAGASLLCGLAPSPGMLIAARLLQGVAAALLTPGSLAILQAVFAPEERARAIGAWTGLGGIAIAAGPFVGGLLVDLASWRWIFLVNLPLAAAAILCSRASVPETRDVTVAGHLDLAGAVLAAAGLGGLTYALIEWGSPWAWPAGLAGVAAFTGFLVTQARVGQPMMPLGMFASRTFSAANAMTLLVYAALGALSFFLVLHLQTVLGWSALIAGTAPLPITLCLLLLAARGGALGERIGPRVPMTGGPLLMAAGSLWLAGVGSGTSYWTGILPGLLVFGVGLALMVAPLTATVLAAVPDQHAGIASGVNNAVARTGSLLAVAGLPMLVGLSGEEYADPVAFAEGYRRAILVCAGLLAGGGLLSWVTVRPPTA